MALTILTNTDAETVVSVSDDIIRIELVNIGEGVCGDYDPEDPDDINLLRFDASIKNNDGEWEEIEDASYCTRLRADADIEQLKKAATMIHNSYRSEISSYESYLNGPSVKKLGEELSWIEV